MTEGMFNEGFAAGARSFLEEFMSLEKINTVVEILESLRNTSPTTGDDKEDFAQGFLTGVAACIFSSRVIQNKELAFDMAEFWTESKYASKDDLWEKFNGVG